MAHGHRLRPSTRHVRRRALRRLDDAVDALGRADHPDPAVAAEAIHTVRIRCKEARALIRLLRAADSGARRRADRWIRAAGSALGTARDEQVIADTLAELAISLDVAPATDTVPDAAALERAAALLRDARDEIDGWNVGRRTAPVVDGLTTTYRVARRRFTALRDDPTDERMHEWRRAVKRLGYEVRAVRRWAPSILRPYASHLDDLGSLLGEDHDLANAVARLEHGATTDDDAAAAAIRAARERQSALRDEALHLGASLFAETPRAFRRRLRAYVRARRALGPERRRRRVGGVTP